MRLDDIFTGIDGANIGVIGDFCLDVYWLADMTRSELSRETPHYPLPVVEERMQPGGAGNVACNVSALKPASVQAFGVKGADWRGAELENRLRDAGVDTSGVILCPDRLTNAYIKPLRRGISNVVYEDPRLDFENYTPISPQTEEALLRRLSAARLDILCVCDQLRVGCVTPTVRERICQMGREGLTVLVDSRSRVDLYHDVIVKPNEVEAARAVGGTLSHEEAVRALSSKTCKPVLLTLGDMGCMVWRNGRVSEIPARRVEPPIDVCGAGDTFMAALSGAMAAGAALEEAAWFANVASSVVIKKLNMTGTATREEIAEAYVALESQR